MTLFIELTHENNPENNKLISKLKIVYPYIQIMVGNERNRVLVLGTLWKKLKGFKLRKLNHGGC